MRFALKKFKDRKIILFVHQGWTLRNSRTARDLKSHDQQTRTNTEWVFLNDRVFDGHRVASMTVAQSEGFPIYDS